MFSILIPSYNNLNYLKLCIKSIINNSKFNHQIIVHVNEGTDGTLDYLKDSSIDFTFTNYNSGICEGMNLAAKKANTDYILYAHDDFYFCPNWDLILKKEIELINHKYFYLSGTMMNNGQINFDCGNNPKDFDEKKFLDEYSKYNFYDFQGSTWAPHLIHKDIWNEVGGFSEEFFPGTGSDPDLNKKLWDFTNRLPEKYLINRTSKKYILKESFKDVFPSNFLEKTKKGFGVPVGDWLRSFLKDELIYFCDKSFIEEQNLFNYSFIEQLVSRHLSGQEDNTFKVWTYFCFQKWYFKNIL